MRPRSGDAFSPSPPSAREVGALFANCHSLAEFEFGQIFKFPFDGTWLHERPQSWLRATSLPTPDPFKKLSQLQDTYALAPEVLLEQLGFEAALRVALLASLARRASLMGQEAALAEQLQRLAPFLRDSALRETILVLFSNSSMKPALAACALTPALPARFRLLPAPRGTSHDDYLAAFVNLTASLPECLPLIAAIRSSLAATLLAQSWREGCKTSHFLVSLFDRTMGLPSSEEDWPDHLLPLLPLFVLGSGREIAIDRIEASLRALPILPSIRQRVEHDVVQAHLVRCISDLLTATDANARHALIPGLARFRSLLNLSSVALDDQAIREKILLLYAAPSIAVPESAQVLALLYSFHVSCTLLAHICSSERRSELHLLSERIIGMDKALWHRTAEFVTCLALFLLTSVASFRAIHVIEGLLEVLDAEGPASRVREAFAVAISMFGKEMWMRDSDCVSYAVGSEVERSLVRERIHVAVSGICQSSLGLFAKTLQSAFDEYVTALRIAVPACDPFVDHPDELVALSLETRNSGKLLELFGIDRLSAAFRAARFFPNRPFPDTLSNSPCFRTLLFPEKPSEPSVLSRSRSFFEYRGIYQLLGQDLTPFGQIRDVIDLLSLTEAEELIPEGPDDSFRILVGLLPSLKPRTKAMILRSVRNPSEQARWLLRELPSLMDLEVARSLLSLAQCRLTASRSSLKPPELDAELGDLLAECKRFNFLLTFVLDARDAVPKILDSWPRLINSFDAEGPRVAEQLLAEGRVDLCKRLVVIGADLSHIIPLEEAKLLKFLQIWSDQNDHLASLHAWQAVNSSFSGSLSSLIPVLEEARDNSARLLLLQFAEMYATSPSETELFRSASIGTRILACLPPLEQSHFSHLFASPALLTESLLLSELIWPFPEIIQKLPELFSRGILSDEVFIRYATKAISDFCRDSSLSFISDDEKAAASNSARVVLSENNTYNSRVRESHRYSGTPRFRLATSIFDLCQRPESAARATLECCSGLSSELFHRPTQRLSFVQIIEHLVSFAKKKFEVSQDEELRQNGIRECETMLKRVDLLQHLLASDAALLGDGTSFSLADFASKTRCCEFRDRLIAADHVSLALLVAQRTEISEDPAWAAWGLSLLRMGRYNDAKERFSHIISRQHEAGHVWFPFFISSLRSALLSQIIWLLESGSPPDPASIRSRYQELRKVTASQFSGARLSDSAYLRALDVDRDRIDDKSSPAFFGLFRPRQQRKKRPALDSARFMQAIYYLHAMGTPADLVRFWCRHQLYEDAVRFFGVRLDLPDLFAEMMVAAVRDGLLDAVRRLLRCFDGTLARWHDYLAAAAERFHEQKLWDALLDLQLDCGCPYAAAQTALHFFTMDPTLPRTLQLRLLETARDQLALATAPEEQTAAHMTAMLPSALAVGLTDLLTLSRQLKTINLQFEVLEFASRRPEEAVAVSLFGGEPERVAVAEWLLVAGAPALAFRLVQEAELPALRVYKGALGALAAARQGAAITAMVRQVQALLGDEERDDLLRAAIEAQAALGDLKAAEQWVALLADPSARVRGYIACLKLKLAYMESVKLDNAVLVREVREAAGRFGLQREAELCDKWLVAHDVPSPY